MGTASDQMLKLLELGNDLAAARTSDEVIARMLVQGMHAVDAIALSIWELRGTVLAPVGVSVNAPLTQSVLANVPLDGPSPLAAAVRNGEAIFLGNREEYRTHFQASYDSWAAAIPSQELAVGVVPLIGSASVVGGLVFTYAIERDFTASDRAFKEILARQCALALERLQREDAERSARSEAELLNRLIATLNSTESPDQIFELALDTVERGAGCDRSAILLYDQHDVMRFRAHHGLSAEYRAAVEGHAPWPPGTIDPQPIAVADTELDDAWASFRELFRTERIRALAFVPLVHRDRLVGKVMLYRAEPRAFTPRELALATTAAHHVALAVERSAAQQALEHAFAIERAAHLEAEAATRGREEIISVVSHDLRSPLGAILVGASGLLSGGDIDKTLARNVAGRIHRQAERMARLLDDLVDFAAIQAGRVALSRQSHPPATILDAANDMFGAIAEEQGLRFVAHIDPALPAIECDSERALQVMANLVSNALKVTPRGGSIEIGAHTVNERPVFFVKDTGPGIPVEDQPKLFERFWRGEATSYRGAGLGLSIARGIVDAHGGQIWVESQPGSGSTFFFSLAT
ncbi:MAG: ATP-binding protein [Kofleriaceae bacterium]